MTFNAVLIRLFLAFALSATSGTLSAQIMIDPEEAFKVARTTQKPVLLIFSGSDWCVPCIRFDREILADSTFLRYAKGHIILLKADFPQRSKVSPPLKSAYEKLADQFNKEGTFPKLIL
ncbi:MAG: thioredoxin family protein, partial [Proteobacteria bacterium]